MDEGWGFGKAPRPVVIPLWAKDGEFGRAHGLTYVVIGRQYVAFPGLAWVEMAWATGIHGCAWSKGSFL